MKTLLAFQEKLTRVLLLIVFVGLQHVALGQAPSIETLAASDVTSTGATLRASAPVPVPIQTVEFEWGTSTNYGNRSAAQQGGSGYALFFDGVNDSVSAGSGQFPSTTNSFSVEFWAKPVGVVRLTTEKALDNIAALPEPYAVFPDHGDWSGYPAGHVGAGVAVGTNGVIVAEHTSDFLSPVLVYTGSLSGWTHVAVVYSSGIPKLFLNGVLVRTGLTSGRIAHPSANLSGLDNFNYGRFMGTLDELRIWGTTLDEATLQTWMNSDVAPSHPAFSQLLLQWKLNEGSGGVAADGSGHGKTGTLAGSTWTTDTPPSEGMFAANISGLTPGTTYHFRAVATNDLGTSVGQDLSFTTGAPDSRPPSITTLPATSVTATGATLRASAPFDAPPQTVRFEWGTSTDYGNTLEALSGPGGYALEFDGVDDQVTAGTGLFPSITNNFTMEFWAKPAHQVILTTEAPSGNITFSGAQPYAILPDHGAWSGYPGNHVGAGIAVGTNGVMVLEHTSDVMASVLVYTGSLSGWTHVAVVYAAGKPHLYLNGLLVRTGVISGRVAHPSSNLSSRFGSHLYGRFKGTLDEVRIWSTALDEATLQAWMTREIAETHPAFDELLLGWPLTGAIGSVEDVSGNGRNGTISGAPLWVSDTPGNVFIGSVADLAPSTTYHFRAVASNSFGVAFGMDEEFTTASGLPVITRQPTDANVLVGGNVSFTVAAEGLPTLYYQWRLNGTNLDGATDAVLALTNVQVTDAGTYSVTVSNSLGTVTSADAVLRVSFPAARIQIPLVTAMAGGPVTVPVEIVANGNENALQFSVSYNPGLVTFASATLGTGVEEATLFVNTSQVANGRVGCIMALPTEATLEPGLQTVIVLTFNTAVRFTPATTPMSFVDTPTVRQLVDAQAGTLTANYASGLVNLSPSVLEADVSPRPNGDRTVTVADWVLLGRFAARLDYPTNPAEFQKADCAPRSTLGDGNIGVTDWVQAGRYAAGADPLTPTGGPTNEVAAMDNIKPIRGEQELGRLLKVSDAACFSSQTGLVSVTLAAQGDEAAVGFSLSFDSASLEFVSATKGTAATGATLNVNSSQATQGRLGFALALSTGTFPAGDCELVKVSFRVLPTAQPNWSDLSFIDSPVRREISSAGALPLISGYENGTLTLWPIPELEIALSADQVTLSWPSWATNLNLQACGSLVSGSWTNVTAVPELENERNKVVVPTAGPALFYRLAQP